MVNTDSNSHIKKSPLGCSIFSRGGGPETEAVRTAGEGCVDSTGFEGALKHAVPVPAQALGAEEVFCAGTGQWVSSGCGAAEGSLWFPERWADLQDDRAHRHRRTGLAAASSDRGLDVCIVFMLQLIMNYCGLLRRYGLGDEE